MNCEIICVGTELLLGDIVNTNAQYLSKELAVLGINVFSQSVVGDNFARLKKAILQSRAQNQLIILTGGLGPTNDDLTKETVCEAFSLKPVQNDAQLEIIQNYFKASGRAMPKNNIKQAFFPVDCTIFPNDIGTAAGCAIEQNGSIVIMLPGPPKEMITMFEHYVKKYLAHFSDKTFVSHNINVCGIGESAIAEMLSNFLEGTNPTVSPYAKAGEVSLRVTASSKTSGTANTLCQNVIDSIKNTLGDNVYGIDKENIQQAVVELLIQNNFKLATAESCTAGLLSSKITDVSGASKVFEFGVSAYSNEIKSHALDVNPKTIEVYGAVSAETAVEMAKGIHAISGADIGLSITGVAGPESSENKPVGTVFFALTNGRKYWVQKIAIGSVLQSREKIRDFSVVTALDFIRRYIISGEDNFANGFLIGETPIVINPLIANASCVKAGGSANFIPVSVPATDTSKQLSDHEILEMMGNVFTTESAEFDQHDFMDEDAEQMQFMSQFPDDEDSDDIILDVPADQADFNIANTPPKKESSYDDDDNMVKPPLYLRFIMNVFPYKGDSVKEIIRKIVFLIAVITLTVSSVYLITYFATAGKQVALVDNARQEYIADNTSKNDDGTFSRFNALAQENSDIKGWIKIPNSKVDNPVYQTGDNDFYVTHNMKKEPSRYGAVFADYRAEINADKSSQNIVLYGHHMNDSTMFGSLKKYRDINFYKQNPTFEFDTIFKDGDYKVFSVFLTNTLPEHDDGYVFNYRPVEFSSNSAFLSWINEVKRRSLINTPVDIIEGDEILTLSTCIYDFDDARLVVMARRVRDGESADVNVTEAFLNPSPLYPDIWYTKRGQSIPEHVNNLSNDLPTVRPEPPTSSQPGASSNLSSEISGSSSSSVAPPSSESPASSAKPPVTPPDTPSSAVPPPPSSEPSAPPVESVPTPDPTPSPDPTPDPDPTPEPTPDPDPEPTPDPDPEPTPNP